MVSLKDIAKVCNVSTATVSKALNDKKDIGKETKEIIRQKAQEMGYLPNFAAKSLKTNRTRNIGVLFADESRSGLTHDYFAHILDSFKRKIEQKGYDMTFINCYKSGYKSMSFLDHVKYRNFDAIIVACIDFESDEVVELVKSGIPVVTIDYVFNNKLAVISDNENGIKSLFEYAYNLGHRRIAYIHGQDTAVTQCRLAAFYASAEFYGVEIPDEYIKASEYRNIDQCYALTDELMSLPNPPTCIFYPDDYAAFGGINWIRKHNLSIPKDLSIIGYDGLPISQMMFPQLTTWYQDTEDIGRAAASLIIQLLEKPRTTVNGQT